MSCCACYGGFLEFELIILLYEGKTADTEGYVFPARHKSEKEMAALVDYGMDNNEGNSQQNQSAKGEKLSSRIFFGEKNVNRPCRKHTQQDKGDNT